VATSRADAFLKYRDLGIKFNSLVQKHEEEILKLGPMIKKISNLQVNIIPPETEKLFKEFAKGQVLKTFDANVLKLARDVSEIKSPVEVILGALEDEKVQKTLGFKGQNLKKELQSVAKNIVTTENILVDNSNVNDASEQMSEYYEAVVESQAISSLMLSVADEIVGVQKNKKKSVLEKIVGIFEIIEDKMKKIAGIVKSGFKSLIKRVKDAINTIKKNAVEGAKKIAVIFKEFAKKLSELITKIIEKIFGFVSWLNGIAKRMGFGIDEISLKLPSVETEIKNLIVISVPVLTINTPEVTFVFKPVKKFPGRQTKLPIK